MNEETPLTQFQEWYGSRARAGLDSQSEYVKLREAFFAGYAARPRPPIEPSRDALGDKKDVLERYRVARYAPAPRFMPSPAPDYIQHGTVTGRLPARRPYDPGEKARHFAEVYNFEPKPASTVEFEVLERVRDELRDTGQVTYPVEPADDGTNPGFPAVTRADTTVWDGRG